MTVCVFNPSENKLWADTTCMAGGYYVGHVNKIAQRESPFYVHTLAVAGTSWLCSLVTKLLMNGVGRASAENLDHLELQEEINEALQAVPTLGEEDAFDAILVEYNKDSNITRVFKFNNTMFPFEMQAFGRLICIGQPELCAAVSLAYDVHMENADLIEFKDVSIGEMINRLSKYSATVQADAHALCYNTKNIAGGSIYVP